VLTMMVVGLVVGGYAVYVMKPEERLNALRSLERKFWMANDAVVKVRAQDEPFRAVLKARTPMPLAVPALVGLNVLVFVGMLLSGGSFSDSSFLVGWGASFGPRTSNGEWWRLATSLFVHAGLVHLLVVTAGLVQAGITLERMLGPLPIAVVFASAGLFSGMERLSQHPMDVGAGGSGAVMGVYGLLIATLLWNVLQRRLGTTTPAPVTGQQPAAHETLNLRGPVAPLQDGATPDAVPSEATADAGTALIPMKTLTRMAPAAAIFALYTLASGFGTPEVAGLLCGFICGLVFARRSAAETTPMLQPAAAFGVTMVIIVASAAMLSGIADVRPEIARVVAVETRTAGAYEKAVAQFKNGALTAQALEKVITQKIVPELHQAHARLKAVSGVPAQHRPLVASAEEYFRLRDESWRLRADALRKSNMGALRAADRSERASLEALGRLRPADVAPAEAASEGKSDDK
jgi:membrane associated rhomboid family serine protease